MRPAAGRDSCGPPQTSCPRSPPAILPLKHTFARGRFCNGCASDGLGSWRRQAASLPMAAPCCGRTTFAAAASRQLDMMNREGVICKETTTLCNFAWLRSSHAQHRQHRRPTTLLLQHHIIVHSKLSLLAASLRIRAQNKSKPKSWRPDDCAVCPPDVL